MWRAQDPARSARSRKNGARSTTIKSRALGALKLASCARSARWECAREAGRFVFSCKGFCFLIVEALIPWCEKNQWTCNINTFYWIYDKLWSFIILKSINASFMRKKIRICIIMTNQVLIKWAPHEYKQTENITNWNQS